MADVALTAALRSNLLSLQGTQKLLDQTQLRLATGRKVNSALDDANAFFAAQSLNNRASDLSRLLDGMGQGIQVLKAADDGISALTSLVEQAEAIANEAKDQASGNAVDIGTVDLTAANIADLVGSLGVGDGDSFTLQAGTTGSVVEFTINSGDTLADLVNKINGEANFAAKIVDGTTPGTNYKLQIATTNGADLITAEGTNTPAATLGLNVGTTAASTGVPEDLVDLQNDYNEILSQIDQLITDTGYRGTNLLNGSTLSVDFNNDGSSSLDVSGVTFDSATLGLTAADFDTIADIESSLTAVDTALSTIRSTARSFGVSLNIIQQREDFTNSLISTLKEGSDKLTLADSNEEGAKLLSLQTSQQLGITSLSLASQAQQSVLRLF